MARDNQHDLGGHVGPALGLGLAAAGPLLGPIAGICVVVLILGGIYDTATAPFQVTDEKLDALLVNSYPADGIAMGVAAGILLAFVAIGLVRKFWFRRRFWDLRVLALLALAYAGSLTAWGFAHGTHPWAQLSYSWSKPRQSAILAWGCPASVASGAAEIRDRSNRFDLMACKPYVDEATMEAACWQVMRGMKPMGIPTSACWYFAYQQTGLSWPQEGVRYEEWDRSSSVPRRNPPLATPDLMRAALEKKGLTPR